MAQPAQLSQSQRGLIQQASAGLGGAVGAYTKPDLTSSQGAMDAALQAQKYGHMQDYATFMDTAQKLQSQESRANVAAQDRTARAQLQEKQLAQQAEQADLDRRARSLLADANNASSREVTMAKIAAEKEMLKSRLGHQSEENDKQAKSRIDQLNTEMEARWKMLKYEEKAKTARAKLSTASTNEIKKSDFEALDILLANHPDEEVRKKYADSSGTWWKLGTDGVDNGQKRAQAAAAGVRAKKAGVDMVQFYKDVVGAVEKTGIDLDTAAEMVLFSQSSADDIVVALENKNVSWDSNQKVWVKTK